MDVARHVAEILTEAEAKLNELVAEALQQRNHGEVQRLSRIAQRVASAADLAEWTPGSLPDGAFAQTALANAETVRDVDLPEATKVPGQSPTQPKPYPQFYRNDRELIKIGYSKTDRRTYEHRSPRELLNRLAGVITDLGSKGRRFITEQLLPPQDLRLADVPSYQVYLCLAFLVLNGLVQKHGRSGYTIVGEHANDLLAGLDAKWNELPVR